ncbi:MAG: GNAT family N-acetyltransferase [Sneathiella sp.]|uniref:GNAT family N-acetyltransferase n=1 Tax=Sneathiella sp. TaxID=1964365 RepID=UPI000C514099|nr:GNAT family N-acetyltransferase [Sneathiella sp.]MAZ03226.1 GNAT family N-acetyltransferase [Sneathiella sp.]
MNDKLQFRIAGEEDLPEIVRLLVQDQLGSTREVLTDPLPQVYLDAFDAMKTQPGNDYIVGVTDERIVCCYQFTVIHGISRSGSSRAQIEGVRVDDSLRGQNIGKLMMTDAIERARSNKCRLLQLTTDKSRPDAHRFYEGLGLSDSHIGYKLDIT